MARDAAASAEFHRIRHLAAIKAWDKRGRKKAAGVAIGPEKPAVSRGDWRNDKAEAERQLLTGRVVKSKPLGGGVSKTFVVTLENGMKGTFKFSAKEWGSPEHEVAAWEVAKAVGMDDMVPPAVIREAPTDTGVIKQGSVAQWQDGEVAGTVDREIRYDGDEDLQRAALFDFIVGNSDRHEGNWVVNNEGKVRLIDHNLSFDENGAQSEFIDEVKRRPRLAGASPARLVAPYLAQKSRIADSLRKLGLSKFKIQNVLGRIDHAASSAKWSDVFPDWN